MKKILFVLLVLCVPYLVLADSAGPSIIGYDAVVINKSGAKDHYSDKGRVVPYNTKIRVNNEYDGTVDACLKDKDECYNLSVKDIAPLKAEVVPKDLLKADNAGTTLKEYKIKVLVINKNGIKLKKGPSDAYGEYNKVIPYKTVLNVTYAINSYSPEGYFSWMYVDDGNNKGWIDEGIASYFTDSILLFDDVKFYDIDTGKVIETIPAETIINEVDYGENKLFFTYNDKSGYIMDENSYGDDSYRIFGVKNTNGYVLTIKSTEIMSKGKAITAVPTGERIKVVYANTSGEMDYGPINVCINENTCYYYVEYNNVKGFILSDDVMSLDYEDTITTKTYDKELKLYDVKYGYYDEDLYNGKISLNEYSKAHDTGKTVPANTTVTVYTKDTLEDHTDSEKISSGSKRYDIELIKYGSNIGWVVVEETDDREYYQEPIYTEESEDTGLSQTTKTLIYAGAGALLLAIIAVVVIVIINKKKKNKEVKPVENKPVNIEETKIEVKEEPKVEIKEEKKDEE